MSDTPEYFYRVIGARVAEIEIERLTPKYVFCKRSKDTGFEARYDRDKAEFDKIQAIRVGIVQALNRAKSYNDLAEEQKRNAESLSKLLSDLEVKEK